MSESWVTHLIELANVLFANPTRGWPRCTMSRLEYNLASRSLNGIQVESPSDQARVFGPADWFTGKDDDLHLDYRRLGLQVECFDGVITSFRAILLPQLRPSGRDHAFRPADLTLTGFSGSDLTLSSQTTDRDLSAALGAPIETTWVGADRWHAFVAHGNLIESYHDKLSGSLLEIVFGLAVDDREQRQAA
jgi:hypothetical protein